MADVRLKVRHGTKPRSYKNVSCTSFRDHVSQVDTWYLQLNVSMSANIVDTPEAVANLIDNITNATRTPFIFVDLEGINLSRQGSISLMQLLMPPNPVVHLVDVFSLQREALDTVGTMGKSLKTLLESEHFAKIFFDVRNDCDALFSHFGVSLTGVIDLQLVE